MTNAMAADYSWDRSAREYSNLYVNLVQGTGAPAGRDPYLFPRLTCEPLPRS